MTQTKPQNTLPDTIGTKSRISSKPKYGKRELRAYWKAQAEKKRKEGEQ